MWVRTEYGRLVNLSHTFNLRVVASSAGYWVQDQLRSELFDPVDLTRPKTEPEARHDLDRLAEAFASERALCDLENSTERR